MRSIRQSLLLVISVFSFVVVNAQRTNRNTKPNAPAQIRAKAPKLNTSWGGFGDSAVLNVTQATALLSQPVVISDDKKKTYNISTYHFMYKRRGVTEDEETGKTSANFTTIGDLFKTTPLPALWINNVAGQLRPGEEFYLFDIIVKDATGWNFYAPALRIIIK